MKLPPMNALRAFEAVSRLGSVTRAAEELCVSQGAVSQQLRNLEDNLDRELFIRTSNSFELSEDGEEFAEVVHRSLKDISVAAVKVKREQSRRNLTISAPPGFAERWLMPRLGEFYASYPDVTIALDKSFEFATFRNDGIDAAIRFGDGTFEGLHSDYLFAWRKWAVASPDYIAEHGKLADLAHPKQHRLIDCRYASKDLDAMCGRWEHVVASDSTDPKQPLIVLPDNYQALTAAIHGRGIALLPNLLLEDDIEAGNIVYANNQSVSVPGGYYYVSPTAARPNSVLDAFRDWLLERTVKLRSEDDSP